MTKSITKDLKFLNSANEHARIFSKDPSTKVAAIIVDPDTGREISRGYNGFPKGISDITDRLNDRKLKNDLTLHAEHNACFFAGAFNTIGKTLYSTHYPCRGCALSIIQGLIARVVTWDVNDDQDYLSRWRNQALDTQYLFNEVKIEVDFYSREGKYDGAIEGIIM